MTLNSRAKVIKNLLRRVKELETTMNHEPRDEIEEVSHSFTAEVMAVSVPDKFKRLTMPLYDGITKLDDHLKRILIDNSS